MTILKLIHSYNRVINNFCGKHFYSLFMLPVVKCAP